MVAAGRATERNPKIPTRSDAMTTVVTGAAGFIGFHATRALLEAGERVLGLDSLNGYYDPALKQARLAELSGAEGFRFVQADIAESGALEAAIGSEPVRRVLHLAAQAGVRYSLENPHAYAAANLTGHLNVLEFCRARGDLEHLVYASSSSVYGGNTKVPFSESDPVDHPVSLYAATKKADELMSHAYAHLYRIPQTGLRFFTIYGPWGRPDMAYWLFADAILEGRPIRVFNHGQMKRDFTYIEDAVAGIVAALDRPPGDSGGTAPHRVFNIGNNSPVALLEMISLLETALGQPAKRELLPMQPGDVEATYADIEESRRELGFSPRTPLGEGLSRFVDWFVPYRQAGLVEAGG